MGSRVDTAGDNQSPNVIISKYHTGVKYSTVPSEAYQNLPKNSDNLRTGVGRCGFLAIVDNPNTCIN